MKGNAYQPSLASQISHELHIPLVGIMGMADFLKKTPLDSQQKEYLQVIVASANRLLSLKDKLHEILKGSKGNAL